MKNIYLYGASGLANKIGGCARLLGWNIAGFVDDDAQKKESVFLDAPIISFEQIPAGSYVHVSIGNCKIRQMIYLKLIDAGHTPVTLIHPNACVASNSKIGMGSYVGALANIDPACVIGDFCIINNQSGISHDCRIADACHICPASMLAGGVTVGKFSWIGLGSLVIEQRKIGENVLIGAGSVVVKDIPDNSKAYGVPAKVVGPMPE